MKFIILFLLTTPLYRCFHFLHLHIPIQKTVTTYYCISPNSKIQGNEETNNSGQDRQSRESMILKTNPDKKSLTYKYHFKGTGIDERYSNTIDEIEYHTQMEKLAKFSYQMKLLKKLESNKIAEPCKLQAIDEYNFLFEKRKYVTNIESGGLYDSWEDSGF
uniref:Uncharacterized protein n=1 Tax=viral metagenome TaxID=1070528 RepID=A0A6C0DDY4_9ZZZZ